MKASAPWKLAVYVAVRDPKGRVLMLRRAESKAHFPGCWELPGGKPAQDQDRALGSPAQVREESFDETGLVELFEETGLDLKLTGVAGAVEGSVPEANVAMLILESRSRSTKVELDPEHDQFRWVPLDEVCSLKLRPGFDQFFAEYTKCLRTKKASRRRA